MAAKKIAFAILALVLVSYLVGCGKKQQSLEEMQEPMSMEALGTLPAQIQGTQVPPATETKLESLPPAGPYQPTAQEIQTALKNAGYYAGLIDGKIGPLTKKATKEFQQANDLEVDGKVGLKTWAVLSKYLNPEPATSPASNP